METSDGKKVIIMGFGESEDPLPECPQLTRFRVFAGQCLKCGCAGRKLLPAGSRLVLVCDVCQSLQNTSLEVSDLGEITYVYWCNSSKFASDEVQLSAADARTLDELIRQSGEEYEAPYWAVVVVGGRCRSSDVCLRCDCPYLVKSQ